MDFDLTKEQEMIRKEVRKFAQEEIAPIAGDLDETETFSAKLTRKMGEIGLFGMFVSDQYEGQGLDYISYIIGVEEVARIDGLDVVVAVNEHVAPAGLMGVAGEDDGMFRGFVEIAGEAHAGKFRT